MFSRMNQKLALAIMLITMGVVAIGGLQVAGWEQNPLL
jgi:hypothetical protein